jgi:D-aminopeptidase
MICYEFKGGTGTASRRVEIFGEKYTVGALVQANHGERRHLLVGGRQVGRKIDHSAIPSPWPAPPMSSSIIAIIATDAPLLPHQYRRLAQRATIGLARTGGYGLATSGDIFLAFSTGVHYYHQTCKLQTLEVVPEFSTAPLVIGAAEAVEEAILNALVAAETMTGYQGHIAHALPHEMLISAYFGSF